MKKHKKIGIVAILVLVAVGLGLGYMHRSKPNYAPAQAITHSTDNPSEQKPGKDYMWLGGPTDPKKVIVSSVGINAYVQQVGVDQNNQIAVPDNIHITGWFADSVKPGQKGLSIIDGHLDGHTQTAVFNSLSKVKSGADVTVEFGDGSKKTFTVIGVNEQPANKAARILFSQDPSVKNQLNLITCGGAFNDQTKQYATRVIVSTKLKQ